MSNKGFTVQDKRRGEKDYLDDPRNVAPVSLLDDDLEEVRLTPETNFVHPSAGKVVAQEDKSMKKVGSIILPGKTQRRPTTGTVLEAGVGCEAYPPGTKIVYGLYSGTVLTFKGWDPKTRINIRVLNVDEILATVSDESPELEGVGV